ncbi:hypothetical protein [Streptomyces lateritius]|uniref:hypothetical protein n=1 Tax=Streptomyces lateritius TaxID=67313 RepID=UPI001C8CACE3|nr:hypothetical protein [Streptomyces lateritius]MBX9427488.1 hypothetical protein [Streptomyces lateritius]
MFHTLWIVTSTLALVPLGVASLRGWSPRWSPAAPARATTARGIAAFALYGSCLTPAILGLAGVPGDELLLLRVVAGPLLMLAALGLAVRASRRADTGTRSA